MRLTRTFLFVYVLNYDNEIPINEITKYAATQTASATANLLNALLSSVSLHNALIAKNINTVEISVANV